MNNRSKSSIETLVAIFFLSAFWIEMPVAQAAEYVSMSGPQLYARFCASCHGSTGHGDGPVAKALKNEVPDLTLLVRRQHRAFPRELIEKIVDGRFVIVAHGTRVMPVWGEDFSHAEIGNPDAERATQLIIDRLVDYVEQLQQPRIDPSHSDRHNN